MEASADLYAPAILPYVRVVGPHNQFGVMPPLLVIEPRFCCLLAVSEVIPFNRRTKSLPPTSTINLYSLIPSCVIHHYLSCSRNSLPDVEVEGSLPSAQ